MLKDIRKDQLIRLTDEHTRMAMAYAMRRGKYEISPPHTAQIPKEMCIRDRGGTGHQGVADSEP